MYINGLGFIESCLYLFPAFFENLPAERLLGKGVMGKYLNDDVRTYALNVKTQTQ